MQGEGASLFASLPEHILLTHIWPHLGPYTRAQLRATCSQLRELLDSTRGPHMRINVLPEVRLP